MNTERYRSGHNENDSKSFGRLIPARGFESHSLRQKPRIRKDPGQLFLLNAKLK